MDPELELQAWPEVWQQLPSEYEVAQWVDSIPNRIARAANWLELQHWAERILGQGSFYVGVGVGLAEGLVSNVVDLVKSAIELAVVLGKLQLKTWAVQRDFILYGLYVTKQRGGITGRLIRWTFGEIELKAARDRATRLLEDVEKLVQHPPFELKTLFHELFKGIKDDWAERWAQYNKLSQDPRPSSQYQAGEIAGKVLLEVILLVLMIVSIVGGAARAAARLAPVARRFVSMLVKEFPELAKLVDTVEIERAAAARAETERLAQIGEEVRRPPRAASQPPGECRSYVGKRNPRPRHAMGGVPCETISPRGQVAPKFQNF